MTQKQKKYFKKSDLFKYYIEGTVITVALAWVFYHSIFAIIFLMPVMFAYVIIKKREIELKRKNQFNIQFKDAIVAMSAALSSGYSFENSVAESIREIELLYGEKSEICRELCRINAKIKLNVPIEKLFLELAEKKGIDDINTFAQIVVTAKRSGGNIVHIINNTANVISVKIETMREIDVLISEKRIQQKVMNVIPLLMITYISITSYEFFDVMYKTFAGRLIMTVCLIIYIASYCISERIVNIKI